LYELPFALADGMFAKRGKALAEFYEIKISDSL
jgi:hypothetical protein